MKRIFSLLMVMLMIFSLFAPSISAEGLKTSDVSKDKEITDIDVGDIEESESQVSITSVNSDEDLPGKDTEANQNSKGVDEVETPSNGSEEPESEDSTGKDTTEDTTTDDSVEEGSTEGETQEQPKNEEVSEETTEENVVEDEEDTNEEDEDLEEPIFNGEYDVDKTGEVKKDGIHVSIRYSDFNGSANYVPSFTLMLATTEGDVISTAKAGPSNFDKDLFEYNLVFKHPGYKKGEEYILYLAETDHTITGIEMILQYFEDNGDMVTEKTNLKKGNYHKFEIREVSYTDGEENEQNVLDLSPSSFSPLTGQLLTNKDKVGFVLVNAQGAPIKNQKVTLQFQDKTTLNLTSDTQGVAWTTNSKIKSKVFEFRADGKRVAGDDDNYTQITHFDADIQDSLSTYLMVLEDIPVYDDASVFTIKTNVDGNTDLSKNWVNADIIFKDSKGVETVVTINNLDTKTALTNGTYTVTAKSDYANVKLSSNKVTVKDGKGTLTATLSPKYILEVDKDGADYSFTVVNVTSIMDKEFKGTNKTLFGVTPNESYMIKDNSDDQVYTVVIDEGSTLTRLILGVGVVAGGQYDAPHTGDNLIFLIILFVVFAVGAGVSFYYFKTNKRFRNATVSLLLITIVLISFIPESIVQAFQGGGLTPGSITITMPGGETVGSGTPGSSSGSSTTPAGYVQTHTTMSLLMVSFTSGFTYGGNLLDADASLEDLRDPFKFQPQRMRNALFMAPNKAVYDKFRHSSSSFALFNDQTGGLVTLYGSNPFTRNSLASAKNNRKAIGVSQTNKLSDRLLPMTSEAMSTGSHYEMFIAAMINRLGNNSSSRQLWKGSNSTSNMNIGDAISQEYIDNYYEKMNNEETQTNATINNDKILRFYLDKLSSIGEKEVASQLEYHYSGGLINHIFQFQVVQAFYVNGDHSKYMFMPMTDAVKWYDYYMKKASNSYKNKKIRNTDQAKVIYNGVRGTAASNQWGKVAPTFTYVGNTEKTTGVALKPQTTKVPIPSGSTITQSALNINPFTGWGYINWGYGGDLPYANTPTLSADLVVHEVDDNMELTGKTTRVPVPVDDRGKDSGSYLADIKALAIKGPMTVETEDEIVIIQPQEDARMTLVDEKDGESLLKENPHYLHLTDQDYWGLRVENKGMPEDYIPVPLRADDDQWRITYGAHTPEPKALYRYLGGPDKEEDGAPIVSDWIISSTDQKYGDWNEEEQMYEHSNAKLELHVQGYFIDPDPVEILTRLNVPEWRLTEYFPDISPHEKAKATFYLSIPASTWRNPSLTNSGLTTFNLIDPDLSNVPWAISRAKLFNDSPLRIVSPYSSAAQFILAGDLLAIKDNSSVMNTKMSSWKNNYNLLNNRIGVTVKGEPENKPKVMKSFTFQYGVKSPHSSYTYSEDRRRCGRYSCWWYRWSGNAPQSYTDTFYNTIVEFNRYVPKSSVENKQFSKQDDKETNGFYWETYQDSTKLNVNPEVLMAHDDVNGNTSVVFTAGDQMRQIQPVHYNVAKYVNVDIDPDVEGMSVATDSKAKQLASSLGGNGLGVTYKGSSITQSFEVEGELELKTYAIDIGSSSLKNAWGNSSYSTDAVNEEFLSRYATKQADGTWLVDMNADGKMKINSKEYGGQKDIYKLPQKSKNVQEHTLVVRGGKLLSVNGNKNLGSLDKDLKDALERMNISTAVGSNVFNTFERGKGASLSESHIATLGNALRGNSDLAKGKRWYNEDTTVMVVREYTNVFDLPDHMYVDKIPMEIDNHLKVPVDKNQYFSKGYLGFSKIRFHVVDGWMEYDSSETTPFGGLHEKLYVVPNVSVLDSFDQ